MIIQRGATLLLLVIQLNACTHEPHCDNANDRVASLSQKEYELIRDLYIPQSADTSRPLKLFAHLGHMNLTNFLTHVHFSEFLRDTIGFNDSEIEMVLKKSIWRYDFYGDYVDTSLTLNPKFLGESVYVLTRDTLKFLKDSGIEWNITLLSEPFCFPEISMVMFYERFENRERVLLYLKEDDAWRLSKEFLVQHDE